jgi:oxygen-dependent protoporphyrinogen oxidase
MAVWLNGRLASGGRPETYPLRLPLSLRGRRSLVQVGLKLRRAVPQYLKLAAVRPGETPADLRARLLAYRDDSTFADFLGKLHPDVKALIRAATNRASAEPEELSAGAGVAHFAVVFSGRSSLYLRNIVGGSSRLPEAIAARLGDRVVLGAQVDAIVPTRSHAELTYTCQGRPHSLIAREVVVATPAYRTATLISGLDDEMHAALRSVRYGPYVVAALLTRETERMPWDDIYAIAVAGKAFNMVFNTVNTLRSPTERQAGGSLMVYGASGAARALLELPDAEIRDRFFADLHDLFPMVPDVVEECVLQRWESGIPYTSPGRHSIQPTLERLARTVSLAGDYLGERGGMETAALSGVEAATAVRSRLDSR